VELLRFSELECHYGAREIFAGVSGVLNDRERVGLVGPNGAGKSSLLRLLAGVEKPFGGTIVRAKDAKLGYLAQGVADETEATLQQLIDGALERAPHEEWGLRNKMLRTMLAAFGFTEPEFEQPLRSFSGGQRAKAALAHLLIDEPDYMILDEPTNHLDIATVRWLESFIANDKRGYIIVSHDRYFLDRVADRIWELERGNFHTYAAAKAPYTAFLEQKEARLARERADYEKYVAEKQKRKATIAGLRATHVSSDYAQVRSREKQLARVEATSAAPPPAPERRSIVVRLSSTRRATNGWAFETKGLSKAYTRPLFDDLTIEVMQGERLAIVGPNGAGKSTLLKILAEQLAPDSGSLRYNPAAKIAYFAQSSLDQLDLSKSAVEAVLAAAHVTDEQARGLLGRMLLGGEAADKLVSDFSGGERRRIMLACLMARRADVLLLDEPTNDLDIDSREALESVLDEYEGAIVVVSHDRYLLSRVCERVLWIAGGAWGVFDGGYEAYERSERDRERAERDRSLNGAGGRGKASRQTALKVRSQLETQIARVEREIAALDTRKAEIDAIFADVEVYEDGARVKTLQAELESLASRNAERVVEWEKLLADYEKT
jgi:ATP-binding cassette, subfamily F, member 3